MKLFKRLLALSLAVFSLLALASCDKIESLFNESEEPEEITIIADWNGEIAYMNYASTLLSNGDATMTAALEKLDLSKYTVKSTITFKDDESYTMVFDSESMSACVDSFTEALLTETYNTMFADSEAAMTLEQYIELSKSALTALFPSAAELTVNGIYKLDGDKLFVTSAVSDDIDKNAYITVALSADKLEFKEAVGENALIPNELLPVTFTKA